MTIRAVLVVFLLGWSSQCQASQLLHSLTTTEGGEYAPFVPVRGFELVLQYNLPELPIGTGFFWQDGSSGSVEFTSTSEAGFDVFVGNLTDGVDSEILTLVDLIPGGPGAGSGRLESAWGFGTPDLVGNQIDLIRLVVDDFSIQMFVDPEFGDGVQWETHFTWEFWGEPVPEPATFAMAAMGGFCVWGRRRRRAVAASA